MIQVSEPLCIEGGWTHQRTLILSTLQAVRAPKQSSTAEADSRSLYKVESAHVPNQGPCCTIHTCTCMRFPCLPCGESDPRFWFIMVLQCPVPLHNKTLSQCCPTAYSPHEAEAGSATALREVATATIATATDARFPCFPCLPCLRVSILTLRVGR